MEMWLWLLLLLFTVADMAESTPNVVLVNKTTQKKVIPEGSSVTLHCCMWTSILERFPYSWHFNHHEASENNSTILVKDMLISGNSTEITAGCLRNKDSDQTLVTYVISNFSHNHSGWYYCQYQVEIPVLLIINSSWTELVVEKRLMERTTSPSQKEIIEAPVNPPFDWSDWGLWIAVGVAGFILVILLIVYIVMRRRQLHNRDREYPVYANMRQVNSSRQPSPRPGTIQNNSLKIDASYQNVETPNPGQRYERGRRPNR